MECKRNIYIYAYKCACGQFTSLAILKLTDGGKVRINKGQNTHINKLYNINQLCSFKVILNIRYTVLFNVLKRKIFFKKRMQAYIQFSGLEILNCPEN